MTRQPEGRLVSRIKNYLESRGAAVFKIHGGDNPYQEKGIPDLLCCYVGRFVAIEVKQPGESPSKAQEYQLHRIRRAGGIGVVVESLEEVKELLPKLNRIGGP